MIVVSDTSAISNLLKIGQIDLLKVLYGRVYITPAVRRELYRDIEQSSLIEKLDWIVVGYPKNQILIQKLLTKLDLGESESIALAIEEKAKYLIIDEYLGRKIAHSLNVKIVGVLGILILAKKEGLINEIRSSIELLLANGFRLNRELIDTVLQRLGESRI